MSESIIFINTMQIEPDKLADFTESLRKSLAFVEANGPQLMVQVYVDEQNMRAYSFQFYDDSRSILSHWQMSDPYIRDLMQYATVQRLDIYGQPDEAVMAGVRNFSDAGVGVTVTPHCAGFARFQSST